MKHNMEHMSSNESILVMSISMLLAGLFSGMNSFANNIHDIRFNINDIYMSFMMIGLMFLFMSIYYQSIKLCIFGILVSSITFVFIRNQYFVNESNFIQSMIPHHSMAVMMSQKLLDKKIDLQPQTKSLVDNIISSQKKEIEIMKKI